ncbi:hypothetical protein SEUCBS140593_006021 [Sporothrix eucalyptigena]|uniref:Initiation-specific alpha-1,6-mannosyltransferase n=1 Tax=Sporothrix eucalyptigena TaxID=1812306 RepID=A0ABP0C1A9_9PEZI
MLYPFNRLRSKRVVLLVAACWFIWIWKYPKAAATRPDTSTFAIDFPLVWKHIHMFNGTGGAWYIPDEWKTDIDERYQLPRTILEAANFASAAASGSLARRTDHALIPLIVHQTWSTTRIDSWTPKVLRCVERWLAYAVGGGYEDGGPPMAYFFWDDEGMLAFMRKYEPDFVEPFLAFFSPVERTDIFRVLLCKWFGGIYGDIDTEPLRHPAKWIHLHDLETWIDKETGATFGRDTDRYEDLWEPPGTDERPVKLLVGLEADVDPASDAYWRMGYTYPVQLTQWALAAAPQHPALAHFLARVRAEVDVAQQATADGDGGADAVVKTYSADPLTRTGPSAITAAVSTWLLEQFGLRWNAVTGLKDGGKAKLISDVLVLPITGFNPGRGKYGNMGSKPYSDADARLLHHAQGSWHKFDAKVELGKLCRTVFGLCRDWSKVPS